MSESMGAAQKSTKVVTVRLPLDDALRIEFVARVEGISVNEVFRRACEQFMTALRADQEFVTRARAHIARENEIAGQLV